MHMTAPEKIHQLVETFDQHLNEYKTRKNETELRRQFLDPFFEALGWDVGNTQGFDERRKEVAHELSVEIDGQQKKADYAFRVGTDKFDFLVEAKKPSVNIETNADAAFQVRRYGWSAKLPINILTDFEHFAVYDCRAKPSHKDKVSTGRVVVYHFKEYAEKWDEIAALFSPTAIRRGALDKFIEGTKGKKGTADVDDDFLMEIERWREALARNIALRNKHMELNEAGLNFAVQMTIDRIVFLRIAEERGMEEYGRLLEIALTPNPSPRGRGEQSAEGRGELQEQNQLYGRLKRVFIQADERYNSGLFHFKAEKSRKNPDSITPDLHIDDKVLKDIIENLYLPKSPYAFAYISADILGSIYERFLGKVIRLTAGGAAKVEDKPEVRKAGGVYYTPTYIVDYIVKNTVGRLLNPLPAGEGRVRENADSSLTPSLTPSPLRQAQGGASPTGRGGQKEEGSGESLTPAEASKLRIVDPACGSGSFLLGAYQYLLDWHLDWYVTHDLEKALKRKVILTQDNKTFRLSMDEKKRILLDNIYGVDLDPQAVEVTKLSLLLKVVEDPGQLTLFSEGHILPDLANNIQCGNSLVGMDYFEGQLELMVNGDEMARVNPFDWHAAFPQVFAQGGFDAVIGNPPYVRQESLGEFKDYLKKKYKTFHGTADLYVYFIELGVSLLRKNGLFSFIVANKWFRTNYGEPLRKWLKNQSIDEIIDFGDLPVFQQATTYPCIIRVSNSEVNQTFTAIQVDRLDFDDLNQYALSRAYLVNREKLEDKGWSLSNESTQQLLINLRSKGISLGEYLDGKVFYGIKTGLNEAFVIDAETKKALVALDKKSEELIKPFLIGREVKRYSLAQSASFLILIPKGWTREKSNNARDAWGWVSKNYPAIASHLLSFGEKASQRYDKGEYWWELRACDYYDEFEKPKIVYPNICKQPEFTLELSGSYTNQKCFIIPRNDKYLLGILNSTLCFFLFRNILPKLRGDFYEPSYVYFKDFPIRVINFADPAEKAMHDSMVTLVERMLALHKNLPSAKTPQEQESVRRQIHATDKSIDALVYQLYGLTEEEIKIVEGEK
jgi:type I restriction-modification system DNA methylase subunit